MGNQLVAQFGLISRSDIIASGSISASVFTGSFTGSLFGTASRAVTASYADTVVGYQTSLVTGSLIPITASYAISTSFAINADTLDGQHASAFQTLLITGSLIPITSSQSITSSWANKSPATTLSTGSIYYITSSWSQSGSRSISSSFSTNSDTVDGQHASAFQTSIITGSTLPITSSWSVTSSYIDGGYQTPIITGSLIPVTSSWTITSSYIDGGYQTPIITGSLIPITSSFSITASYAKTASFAIGYQTSLITGSLIPVTSSQAISSSWALTSSFANNADTVDGQHATAFQTVLITGSFLTMTSSQAVSASWSLTASFANTVAGYQLSLITGSLIPITASQAISSSFSFNADTVDGQHASAFQTSIITGSLIPITSSWAQSSSHALFTRNPTADNSIVARDYIGSRLQNLITNGSGLMMDNYNFTSFVFDQVETHGGGGSFLYSASSPGRQAIYSDEYIPVDPEKYYRLATWAKGGDSDGSNYSSSNRQYFGLILYDIDKNQITPRNCNVYPGAADTFLSATLNPGDTKMYVLSSNGWYVESNYYYFRCFSWYPYTNSFHYEYPAFTYTRWNSTNYSPYGSPIVSGTWAAGGITSSSTGSVINLTAPWPGPILTAGTAVRNNYEGGTYNYIVMSSLQLPQTWSRYEGYIGGYESASTYNTNKFRAGTSYARILVLPNYMPSSTPSDTNVRFSDIWFSELSSRNLEEASTTVPGVIGTGSQSIAGSKTFTSTITGLITSAISASYSSASLSSSWADNSNATTLNTGSTYYITSSFSVTASWANDSSATTLFTASTYHITSSQAVSSSWSRTSSFANNADTVDSQHASAFQTVITTGSLIPITASWTATSSQAVSSSFASNADTLDGQHASAFQGALITGSLIPITSSRAISSSYAITSSFASNADTVDGQHASAFQTSLVTGSLIPITSSFAVTSSWANKSPATTLETSSVYYITASFSNTASYAKTASVAIGYQLSIITGSLIPVTSSQAVSSSWSRTSSFANNADTVDGQHASTFQTLLITGSLIPITSSWSITSSYIYGGYQTPLITGSLIPVTASQAVSSSWSLTSSFSSNSDTLDGQHAPAFQTVLTTGSLIPVTSSWAVTSSYIAGGYQTALITGSTIPITSSQAISSSWSRTSSFANNADTVDGYHAATFQTSIITGSLIPITSSQSVTSSWANKSPATTLFTGSTYYVTSSWSNWTVNSITNVSSSWASSSYTSSYPWFVTESNITYMGGNVGVGTTAPAYKLDVNGSFAAKTKSFIIDHPLKRGKKLIYGVSETTEHNVFVRGKTDQNIIDLPDYWVNLVDEDTITVQLTSIGRYQKLYVDKIENNKVYIQCKEKEKINFYYLIHAERKDVPKLKVEI